MWTYDHSSWAVILQFDLFLISKRVWAAPCVCLGLVCCLYAYGLCACCLCLSTITLKVSTNSVGGPFFFLILLFVSFLCNCNFFLKKKRLNKALTLKINYLIWGFANLRTKRGLRIIKGGLPSLVCSIICSTFYQHWYWMWKRFMIFQTNNIILLGRHSSV